MALYLTNFPKSSIQDKYVKYIIFCVFRFAYGTRQLSKAHTLISFFVLVINMCVCIYTDSNKSQQNKKAETIYHLPESKIVFKAQFMLVIIMYKNIPNSRRGFIFGKQSVRFVHIIKSFHKFEQFLRCFKELVSYLFLFHFCATSSCRNKNQKHNFALRFCQILN